MIHQIRRGLLAASLFVFAAAFAYSQTPVTVSSGWELQDVAKVSEPGAEVSTAKFKPTGWYAATVPGTVLTSLVNNGIYPEPTYGENGRVEIIA